MNFERYFETRFLLAPAHTRITGDTAFSSCFIRRAIDFLSGTDLLCLRTHRSVKANSFLTSSPAISSGSSICTAPGFSSCAIRKAFSKIYGTLSHETTLVANFVIGFIIATASII